MSKDWKGNNHSVYTTLSASNHCKDDREEMDYYATPPFAVKLLLEKESFNKNIWEPACGEFHISRVLSEAGHDVRNSDIVIRRDGVEQLDFLLSNEHFDGDIVTNPPYKYAVDFVRKSLDSIDNGNKVAMLLKIQFLEGKSRKELFKTDPPRKVYVFSSRIGCAKNGEFVDEDGMKIGSAVCYAWFVWIKGYKGLPEIDWIN